MFDIFFRRTRFDKVVHESPEPTTPAPENRFTHNLPKGVSVIPERKIIPLTLAEQAENLKEAVRKMGYTIGEEMSSMEIKKCLNQVELALQNIEQDIKAVRGLNERIDKENDSLVTLSLAEYNKLVEESGKNKTVTFNTIQFYVNMIHEMAVHKGWHESPRDAGTMHMLMVSEIAEATEEARKGMPDIYGVDSTGNIYENISEVKKNNYKPEGEAIELADTVIRIMDYFGLKGWDLEELIKMKVNYNATRSKRHGNKKF